MIKSLRPHVWSIAFLTLLWGLFFWRVWTPFSADQVSFATGDFSYQFVSWTDYAVERLDSGEFPLWNPYMYGGAPFQASSQSALTYPPRVLTIGLLLLQTEVHPWEVYAALQMEVMLHVLLVSWFMYVLVWRLISESGAFMAARLGGVVAALTYSYGGYLGGYPILQAPLLEAGIWLPLVLLGITEATRPQNERMGWRCILFSGVAIGLSLLAGHPQTSFFIIYLALAWLAYRIYVRGWRWRWWLGAAVLMGLVSGGLAAVQLLPTAEFTAQTYRTELSFIQKGGGYSFEELANLLFPLRGTLWNSNYYGVLPLILVGVALWRRVPTGGFWGGVALFGGLLTFGARTPLYGLLYPLLPGLTLFRGQERATLVVAFSLAVLAGLGIAQITAWTSWRERPQIQALQRVLVGVLGFCFLYIGVMYSLAQTSERTESIVARMNGGVITVFILGAVLLGMTWFLEHPLELTRKGALFALLVFDLFSATFMLQQNYEPIPVSQRLVPLPFITTLTTPLEIGQRADTQAVLDGGYNLVHRWSDVTGSDPLQLEASRYYLETIPLNRRWELLSVRTVLTGGDTLPVEVPAQYLGRDMFAYTPFTLWELTDPRPFAHLVYASTTVQTDAEAYGLIREPAFDLRQVAIIQGESPLIPASENKPPDGQTTVTRFEPEIVEVQAQTAQPALLSLSMMDFVGWEAEINGEPAPIYRAYGGLMAVYLPQEGDYTVTLHYESRWFKIGGLISVLAWVAVGIFGVGSFVRQKQMATNG